VRIHARPARGTERWVGDRIEPLTPGDLVFLGSELPHEYRNAPIPGRRARQTEWVVVHFMPQILGDIGQACTTLAPLRRLFERARRGLRVDGSTRGQAEALVLEMVHAQGFVARFCSWNFWISCPPRPISLNSPPKASGWKPSLRCPTA
jgi:hypothetical protein